MDCTELEGHSPLIVNILLNNLNGLAKFIFISQNNKIKGVRAIAMQVL